MKPRPPHEPCFEGRLRAFSLIEMLAAVAILAVLASLFVPLLGKMRASADRATCLHNMRQLGTGLGLYAQDNNGLLPLSMNVDPRNPSGTQVSWQILVQRELGVPFPKARSKSVFICPAARKTYPVEPYRTYGLNLTGDSPTANPPRLLTLSSPSKSALLVETRHDAAGGGYNALSGSLNGVGGKIRLEARHADQANMLMADGSVRPLSLDDPDLDKLLSNIRN